jgi:MurNAc alpha-1-phosphate uridylyltransferase
MYPVAILAGGMATRLFPLTQELPKSMLEISGKPFIHWQLNLLSNSGVKEVVLCLGTMAPIIQDYVGDGSNYGLKIQYSFDGDTALGTAGAIKRALPLLGDHFGIIYGDSYLTLDYKAVMDFYANAHVSAVMTVYRNENKHDKSNVEYRNHQIIEYSKFLQRAEMNYIDYGFSIFNKDVFSKVPSQTFVDMYEIIETLVKYRDISGYEVSQRFYEIGSFLGIKDFKMYMGEILK